MKTKEWDDVQIFEDDNVTKFVFTKHDACVETVLYRYPTYEDRTVICHSVMSGCPIGCRFCGSGDFFVRNLTIDEMLEQIEFALHYTGVDSQDIKKLQIMSMSMGEPMLNRSLEQLYREVHDLHPNATLLMSTSAPDVNYEWFMKLAQDIPQVGLQFSIHESTDEARNKLIPFEKKLQLKDIAKVGLDFFSRTGRKPFFNYCAGTHNIDFVDAQRLRDLFMPWIWNATVSVICEHNDGMPTTNDTQKLLANQFSSLLVSMGFDVRIFDPAGQDTIGGGCGQLWKVQEWVKQNPEKSRKSCGNGIVKVHLPKDRF